MYPFSLATLVGERSIDDEIINFFFAMFSKSGECNRMCLFSHTVLCLLISSHPENDSRSLTSAIITKQSSLSSLQ